MELKSSEGEKIRIERGRRVEVGRKANPHLFANDLTVSSTQIFLELQCNDANSKTESHPDEDTMVSFQVLGRNPVCVLRSNVGGSPDKERISTLFKKSEGGYLKIGDKMSFSVRNPKFFTLKSVVTDEDREILEAVERRRRVTAERKKNERDNVDNVHAEGENLEAGIEIDRDLGLNSLDVSSINPVKEKMKLKDIKDWKWFVEKTNERTDDDEEVVEGEQIGMKKRKKKGGDEDWTGESDDQKKMIAKFKTGKRPKSLRNLKGNHNKAARESGPNKKTLQSTSSERDTHESDEDDDSLGGFIVEDEELVEEQEEVEEEEEEDYDEDESDED